MLLLLWNPTAKFLCWSSAATATSTFVVTDALLDTWSYWSSYTWAQVETSSRTWEYLAGNWFATASTGTLTWTEVIEGSCPSL